MDWYEELASLEYLGLAKDTRILGYRLKTLGTSRVLFHPTCVINHTEIILRRNSAGEVVKLWNVSTRKEGSQLVLVGRQWDSIRPSKFTTTDIEDIVSDYMVVLKSSHEINSMVARMNKKANKK